MYNKILLWLCLLPGIGMAQVDSLQKKVRYYNFFVSGVMIGSAEDADEKDFTISFTTIHGIKFNSGVKVGIGVGFDTYYNLKVLPILLSLTFDQERRPNGLFVQLNGGYSFARYKEDQDYFIEGMNIDENGGFIINPMIGYRMMVENMRIYVLAGYKYQKAEINYGYPVGWGLSESSKQYEFNRFVIQLGFGLE